MSLIPSRYRALRRHDTVAIGLNLVATTITAVLGVLQFSEQATVWHWAGGGAIVLATAGYLVESAARSNSAHNAAERETRRRLARSLIEDLFKGAVPLVSKYPDKTAGVVFLPDATGVLVTEFTYNKKGKPDSNLKFGPLEGCTGHAWYTGEQTYADLAEATPAELERTWKLSPEYITLTQHLGGVVSTPIRAWDDPERMVGIVSVDCEEKNSDSGLTLQPSLDAALSLAASMACILDLAELV
jgi:glucose uptake protein GlcU